MTTSISTISLRSAVIPFVEHFLPLLALLSRAAPLNGTYFTTILDPYRYQGGRITNARRCSSNTRVCCETYHAGILATDCNKGSTSLTFVLPFPWLTRRINSLTPRFFALITGHERAHCRSRSLDYDGNPVRSRTLFDKVHNAPLRNHRAE